MTNVRQGDILLRPVKSIPAKAVAIQSDAKEGVVLARGEGHGHRHMLPLGGAMLYHDTEGSGGTYVKVTASSALLQHLGLDDAPTGDHAPVEVPTGDYEVIQQRQAEGEKAVYRDD